MRTRTFVYKKAPGDNLRMRPKRHTVKYDEPVQGRNEKCNCGSGLKYKKCCGKEKDKIENPKEELLKDVHDALESFNQKESIDE